MILDYHMAGMADEFFPDFALMINVAMTKEVITNF